MPEHRTPARRTADGKVGRRIGKDTAPAFPIVVIGASAGGLDACMWLMDAMPSMTGMAFVLIQHLDPNHKSLIVELLAKHTVLTVIEAADGMRVGPEHVYVIPPGRYVALDQGKLRVVPPTAKHGSRLPFDYMLRSLSSAAQAACIVLSGTGADGSLGLRTVKDRGGLVIAQDPNEAEYDGMPRSAIATGLVDRVLGVAAMPAALRSRFEEDSTEATAQHGEEGPNREGLAAILALVHERTGQDFTLYKPGTLMRRIERRMAMASFRPTQLGRYLKTLETDPAEVDQLAKDLLINVTSFFRDPEVFQLLVETIIPELLQARAPEAQIRVWIAGCSTGEEAYSLAMVFQEQCLAGETPVKLQMFASDLDADAVAVARDGLYPLAIADDVTPERLARFFVKEDLGYRVVAELRAAVVFAVQDVLTDPPFSRLDMISCRNLLIYLGTEAQAKVISFFHFALRNGGVLLLGGSEMAGDKGGRFKPISKSARLYRHVSGGGSGGLRFGEPDALRLPGRPGQLGRPTRHAVLAELCTRYVLDNHAPTTLIVNLKHDILYSAGPTEKYLRVGPGAPTHDVLSLVREGTRLRLRRALQRAAQEDARITVPAARDGQRAAFEIEVQPIVHEGERLLLICFQDNAARHAGGAAAVPAADRPRVAELEHELAQLRTELQNATHDLETSSQEQKAINEEALSVNEEFQSTNEELLTSKEELQSLNEELTALNNQLQETLEQQRTTSNDLQNVLYSTEVATLFLDIELNIRFFTPATQALFHVIQSDVGRPLADLRSLATDSTLSDDAQMVLRTLTPTEREIEAPGGVWFRRRILPYRTHASGVEGVVITFNDITTRKVAAKALERAKQEADQANTAKSRFLAAASHDLRQPLQTLALLQGLLAASVEGEKNQRLLARVDDTLGAMSGLLNTLLDINQIEAGIVQARMVPFALDDLLQRLRDEFAYHAAAQGLTLRLVPSHAWVESDQRLLEQMLRNLLSNALKYTKRGRVLLGCRRHGEWVRIEVWDTGIGIAENELASIFDEYRQVETSTQERGPGLGLGLSIVARLGDLLGHPVRVRSRLGKGSVFSIEMKRAPTPDGAHEAGPSLATPRIKRRPDRGSVLVLEDEEGLRELIALALSEGGHRPLAVANGPDALALVAGGSRPDVILSDYHLSNGMDGLAVVAQLRARLGPSVPAILLTGDISAETLRRIADQGCTRLNKPVKMAELMRAIAAVLATRPVLPPGPAPVPGVAGPGVITIVDDDGAVRGALRDTLEGVGYGVQDFASAEAFMVHHRAASGHGDSLCLLIDGHLPGMSGLDLLTQLRADGDRSPAIIITGRGDVHMAVAAMQAGAMDFIEKPAGTAELLASIERAQERGQGKRAVWQRDARAQIEGLTRRQQEIMALVLAGQPSKNIAADLGISQRTVENHRATIMQKTGATSLPALARLALAAAGPMGAD